MAGGKQIKQEIVLSGEKQYNAAIKEAQRNLKTLQTALKAETAEMGKNATAQQKNEAKVKSLKEQIKEQEKIVQTLREALAAAKEEYGDNGAEVARWEQKLNNARTTLANMKNDLDGVGSGFQGVSTDAAAATVATKSVADALESIGSAGESVSGAIESIFSGMIDVVSDAVGELWSLISETAAKANNWTDIAGYWGTDAQTIQQYARAVQGSANSFEDLQSAVSKIVLGGKGKKITELIGISDVNYLNEWDYAMAVMGQLYSMAQSGKNMTPIYEQIFGEKKSTKVMDLVNDWETIQELLPKFNGNESGYGMSDSELGTMNDLWTRINEIEAKWGALKESFAAGFGAVSLDLLVNVEGTLDGIADYLNAKDDAGKQAALEKIRTNVEEFFTKLGEIIRECIGILRDVGGDLQGSDDPLTSAIGSILVSLADSLQWMVDHAEEVKGAFETIFGVWLLAKLGAVAGQLSSILMQIEAIKAFKGVTLGGSGAAEAAGAAAGGGGLLGTLGLSAIVAAFAAAVHERRTNPEIRGSEMAAEKAAEGDEALRAAFAEYIDSQRAQQETEAAGGVGYTDAELEAIIQRAQEASMKLLGMEGAADLLDKYSAWRQEQGLGNMDWPMPEGFGEGGEPGPDGWPEGDPVGDAADRVIQKLDEKMDESGRLPDDWYTTMTGSGSATETKNENGITGADLRNFNGLPAAIQTAAASGVASGVSGLKVQLDGAAVGRMVAPYVSEIIGSQIVAARNM